MTKECPNDPMTNDRMAITWPFVLRHSLVIGILSLVILFCPLSGCSPKSHPQLIVGMELAYPPFEMIDPQGRPAGVSVDMAQALGQFLGREARIANIPFDGLIPSLQTHKI